jgi:polysaccharide deacetylase 2 family uncharacterized protein YibQ
MLARHFWLPFLVGSFCETLLAVPASAEPRLAIIIDDIGYNKVQSERAANLQGQFTLAILPFTPHGIASAGIAHRNGKELMLHLPMATITNMPVGNGGLVSGMTKEEFVKTVNQDLETMQHIQGVNNHMGSRLTQEAEPMRWLMEVLRQRDLYFVDSRTSAQTKALDIARDFGVPSIKRDVFLDDINDTKAIQYQLNRAINFAAQRGSAVAIGHPYPATLSVLEQSESALSAQGVKLVYLSKLLERNAIEPNQQVVEVPKIEHAHSSEPAFCSAPEPDFLTRLSSNRDLYDITNATKSTYFGY